MWSVLQDCALRYEPPEIPAEEVGPDIAAALLVGGLHTRISPADPALVSPFLASIWPQACTWWLPVLHC